MVIEEGSRCEGVPLRGVAQAQLTVVIVATDEHPCLPWSGSLFYPARGHIWECDKILNLPLLLLLLKSVPARE